MLARSAALLAESLREPMTAPLRRGQSPSGHPARSQVESHMTLHNLDECTTTEGRVLTVVLLFLDYRCPRCDFQWSSEEDSSCDADCPNCGLRCLEPLRVTPLGSEQP